MTFFLRKTMLVVLVILIILIAIFIIRKQVEHKDVAMSNTVSFLQKYMRNANGTWASYMQANPSLDDNYGAGREAISETVGLWLEYAVLVKDQVIFQTNYQLLTTYFINEQGIINWKLAADGEALTTANALVDDLRIIQNLLAGWEIWQEESYYSTAKLLANILIEVQLKERYLADFYDAAYKQTNDELHFAYINIAALEAMHRHQLLDQSILQDHEQLLRNIADQGPFYPDAINITTNQWTNVEEVNLIEQLYIAQYLIALNLRPQLMMFLEEEWDKYGKLYARYSVSREEPTVIYESPAVYGLAISAACQMDNIPFAKQLFQRMLLLQSEQAHYSGGYVHDDDASIFDQLVALIGEVQFRSYVEK